MIQLVVPQGQDGKNLKSCMQDMLAAMKKSEAESLLRKGCVRVNGARVKKDIPLAAGDILDLYVEKEYKDYLPDVGLLYEDDGLLIFNKPPGLSCLEDKPDGKPTLLSVAEEYMRENGDYDPRFGRMPFVCHRLDHYTGGLVLVAKNQDMYEALVEAFAQRRVRKFYKAIVCGRPKRQDTLSAYIIKDAGKAKVRVLSAPARGAKPAVTRYTLEKLGDGIAQVDLELVTGRTHQARAMMAWAGFPILGDDKYGNRRMNKRYGVKFQALWSYRILFETGNNNSLAYLNGRSFATDRIGFPYLPTLDEAGVECVVLHREQE